MSRARFRVGIVGLQPHRSWAAVAHLPALRALPRDFHVTGVANTSIESSQLAAAAYGIGRAFATPSELIACSDIDVVAVTVKVPHHLEIVAAAIAAGKHVYCEWPLGKNLLEARTLARLTQERKATCVVGLQALVAPEVCYARELIEQGLLGDILSSSMVGSAGHWGALIDQANAYTLDPANGATVLSIPVGHALAALEWMLGKITDVSAKLVSRRRMAQIRETGVAVPMLAPDQVLLTATLENGAPLSLHYRGGASHGVGFRWEIHGSRGDLQLTAAVGHPQFMPITLAVANDDESTFRVLDVPRQYSVDDLDENELPMTARNVARMYARMAQDLREHTRTAPSADTALANHRLLEAIEQSARSGEKTRPESYRTPF